VVADTRALRAALPWQPRYRDLGDIVASALAWEQTQRAPERKMAESA
jgi:UDP-glucose 4-epimerase